MVEKDAAQHRRHIAAVGRELELTCRGKPRPLPRTVYFGGGTPGILGADGLRALAAQLRVHADFSNVEEWTCELTPATATPDTLDALREVGVTRVSMGVQTFHAGVARRMGRHNAEIPSLITGAGCSRHFSAGIDLIAGLPGIGKARWQRDLETTLSLGVDHVSVYALNVEEGTALAGWVREKNARLKSDGALMDMLAMAEETLCAAGFARYEISNYARPGKACRHHLGVWRGEDFLGLGPAAVSRAGLRRWRNAPDAAGYVARLGRGEAPERAVEVLDATMDACERGLTALRLLEGWDAAGCVEKFPALAPHAARFVETLHGLARHGLVVECAGRWRLTRRGREVADAVTCEVLREI